MQKTVFKISIKTSHDDHDDDDGGRDVVMEASSWVRWREVFSKWMVTQHYLTRFTPLVTRLSVEDNVSCVELSGQYLVTGHGSGVRSVVDLVTGDTVTLPSQHQGHVQCLALVDLLHTGPYHAGLQHHVLVSGGGGTDSSIIVSVLPDQYCPSITRSQEVRVKRHHYGVLSISVLDTSMAVLGQDNRVSVWSLGVPRHDLELPSVECQYIVPGPAETSLISGEYHDHQLEYHDHQLEYHLLEYHAHVDNVN